MYTPAASCDSRSTLPQWMGVVEQDAWKLGCSFPLLLSTCKSVRSGLQVWERPDLRSMTTWSLPVSTGRAPTESPDAKDGCTWMVVYLPLILAQPWHGREKKGAAWFPAWLIINKRRTDWLPLIRNRVCAPGLRVSHAGSPKSFCWSESCFPAEAVVGAEAGAGVGVSGTRNWGCCWFLQHYQWPLDS